MKLWLKGWKNSLKEKDFIKSLILSFLFLFISFYINFVAGTYATEKISNSVTDIVLSNIRVFDVDGIFIYGSIFIVALITLALVYQNKALPFAIKSISLFVIIRSIFISLTHLGPFPTAVAMHTGNFLNKFTFGGDLFFSGHTGLPFLMALIFWKNKILRYMFLSLSLVFGIVVLLGHLHYSIDVLAAFFITYSVFHMSIYLFKKDWVMFSN